LHRQVYGNIFASFAFFRGDTSELDFSKKRTLKGTGPLSCLRLDPVAVGELIDRLYRRCPLKMCIKLRALPWAEIWSPLGVERGNRNRNPGGIPPALLEECASRVVIDSSLGSRELPLPPAAPFISD
jgi:hypothetical protein